MIIVVSYTITMLALIITLSAQGFVSASYSKFKGVKSNKRIKGQEAARIILDNNNLENINMVEVVGTLTDHYDPENKEIRLSSDIYNGTSIASVAVAAHECGHAIQDKEEYAFLHLRSSIIPLVNFASYAGYFAILLGCFFGSLGLIWLGIFAEVIILLFQLITLPVEVNASRRAIKEIENNNLLDDKEIPSGKTMLTAAALTYVASILSTILEILRLILIFGRRDDEND